MKKIKILIILFIFIFSALLIWGQISDKDLDWIFSKLPHQGLAVNVAVDSVDQVKRIWKKYIG